MLKRAATKQQGSNKNVQLTRYSQIQKALVSIIAGLVCSISQAKSEISIAVDGFGDSLYPQDANGTFNRIAVNFASNKLIAENRDGVIVGDLASTWKFDQKENLYTFTLANQLPKFCDGKRVTAADIVNSLKNAFSKHWATSENSRGKILKDIWSAEQKTIKIKLNQPERNFLRELTSSQFSIFKSRNGKIPCFSGRYEILSFSNSKLILKRKADDQVFAFSKMSHEHSINLLKSGKPHISSSYSYFQLAEFKKLEKKIVRYREGKLFFVALNTKSPNLNTRSDRHNLVSCSAIHAGQKYLAKFEVSLDSIYPIEKLNYQETLNSDCKNFREKRLVVIVQSQHRFKYVSEQIFGNYPNVTTLELEKQEFIKTLNTGKYDVALIGLSTLVNNSGYLKSLLAPGNLYNFSKFSKIDAFNTRNETIFDITKRFNEINKNEILYVPLGTQASSFALSDSLAYHSKNQEVTFLQESATLDLDLVSLKL